jgi:hypothetical protein
MHPQRHSNSVMDVTGTGKHNITCWNSTATQARPCAHACQPGTPSHWTSQAISVYIPTKVDIPVFFLIALHTVCSRPPGTPFGGYIFSGSTQYRWFRTVCAAVRPGKRIMKMLRIIKNSVSRNASKIGQRRRHCECPTPKEARAQPSQQQLAY